MPQVRVISFDLWDTVFIDDSDEPKRKAQGLPPKPIARRELVHKYLSKHAPVDRAMVDLAYDTTDAAFREVWHNQHVTWSVAVRLGVLLKGLKRELPADEFAELVRLHEDMELAVRPDLVPGVAEAVRALAAKYKLVIISDAIFSPGRALRELLSGYGLLDAFSAFVFSDEAGCSKPDPTAFHKAAEMAGCRVEEIVHIGDREHNDIAGPKGVGARSVLLTAAIDRGSANTAANAICRYYRDLPGIIEALDTK